MLSMYKFLACYNVLLVVHEYPRKSHSVTKKLKVMRLSNTADKCKEGIAETLSFYDFPSAYWQKNGTDNPLECIMREIQFSTNVVGSLPDNNSALVLVVARVCHIACTKWSSKRYHYMDLLRELNVVRRAT